MRAQLPAGPGMLLAQSQQGADSRLETGTAVTGALGVSHALRLPPGAPCTPFLPAPGPGTPVRLPAFLQGTSCEWTPSLFSQHPSSFPFPDCSLAGCHCCSVRATSWAPAAWSSVRRCQGGGGGSLPQSPACLRPRLPPRSGRRLLRALSASALLHTRLPPKRREQEQACPTRPTSSTTPASSRSLPASPSATGGQSQRSMSPVLYLPRVMTGTHTLYTWACLCPCSHQGGTAGPEVEATPMGPWGNAGLGTTQAALRVPGHLDRCSPALPGGSGVARAASGCPPSWASPHPTGQPPLQPLASCIHVSYEGSRHGHGLKSRCKPGLRPGRGRAEQGQPVFLSSSASW